MTDKTPITPKPHKRFSVAIVFNPFNFHVPKFQKIEMRDMNGRHIRAREFLIGPFGFSINWRWSDQHD